MKHALALITCGLVTWLVVSAGPAAARPAVRSGSSAYTATATNPWTVVSPTPNMLLDAVSADSPTDAWAVGCTSCGNVLELPAAAPAVEHYTAQGWAVVSAPPIPTPTESCGDETPNPNLTAVKAFSATDVWAVGDITCLDVPDDTPEAFTAHWTGTGWIVRALPASAASEIFSIDGFSNTNLWLAGTQGNAFGRDGVILYGGGQGFKVVVRNPDASLVPGITAITPTLAYATGINQLNAQPTAVVAHGGTTAASWKQQVLPDSVNAQPGAITASSASDIWIAGSLNGQEWVTHYNGHSWSVNSPPAQPPAHPNPQHILLTIAEHGPSDVWTAGWRGWGSEYNLFDGWNGSSWVNWGGPNPGSGSPTLGMTAIPGTSHGFWAVGYAGFEHCSC